MKKASIQLASSLLVLVTLTSPSNACTTFCFRDANHLLFGKNFDFYTGIGHILINKRNVTKRSFPVAGEKTFTWTSTFGSVTFNQFGREFPYGGINEAGLVIEQMYLSKTQYPELDDRYAVAELQWIQYQLDNASTVDQVIASDSHLRITKVSAPIHFLVCDSTGNVATIEYLNGEMVVHRGQSLPVCALTNDTYDESISFSRSAAASVLQSFTSGSFHRFANSANMLDHFDKTNPVQYAFKILEEVRQEKLTRWSIVYDVKKMKIYYKTESRSEIRNIDVEHLDFNCQEGASYIDINEPLGPGPMTFRPYSSEKNSKMVGLAFRDISDKPEFERMIPPAEEIRAICRYPESTTCAH